MFIKKVSRLRGSPSCSETSFLGISSPPTTEKGILTAN